MSSTVKVHDYPCHRYGRQSGHGARRRRRAARTQSQEHEIETVAVDINNSADQAELDLPVVTDDEVIPTLISLGKANFTSKLNSQLNMQKTDTSEKLTMESCDLEDNMEDTMTADQVKKIMQDDFQKLMDSTSGRASGPNSTFDSTFDNGS